MEKALKEKRGKNPAKVGAGRMLLWQSRDISKTFAVLITTFLTIYCTDALQIPAAIVGTILVLSKVLDGFTDMVAGYIVDRTKTRFGKGRPYEVFIVGLWLCTWLLFSCPAEFSMVAKCIWVFLMYALVNSICMTFLNANSNVYMVRAFNKQEQYVSISSYGGILLMLAGVIVNVSFPMSMETMATSAAGWSRLVGMYAIPLVFIGILRFFTIKEKYDTDVKAAGEKLKFKDVISVLKSNQYIYIIALMNLVFNLVTNMGVGAYYYRYIVGNVGALGIVSLTNLVILPVALTFPKLIQKFSVTKLTIAGFLVMAFGFLLNFFAGGNIVILIIASFLTGAGAVPASMLSGLLIIDCAEYNEWKGLRRLEGTMSSLVGFSTKVGSAVGAGLLGVLLSVAGYTGVAETNPDSALTMIRMLFSIVPMLLYILVAFTLKFYKLDKNIKQIREENQQNRESVQGAET